MANTVMPDGVRIRTLRIQRGWTQEQLAGIAGVSTRSIQRAERGAAASLETLRALAGGFGIEFAELLAALPSPAASRPADTRTRESEPGGRAPRALPEAEAVALIGPCPDGQAALPTRRAVRLAMVPELAVLAVSITALVSAIAFVGHDWSSRYTPRGLVANGRAPSTVQVMRPVADLTVEQLPEGATKTPGETRRLRGSSEEPERRQYRRGAVPNTSGTLSVLNPVAIEGPSAAAAAIAPTNDGSEADLVPQPARLPGIDPTDLGVVGEGTGALPLGFAAEGADPGGLRVALREAGKKTGGFFARAGSAIGASVKTAF